MFYRLNPQLILLFFMAVKRSVSKVKKRATPERFYKKVVISFITLALILILFIVYFSVITVEVLITPEEKREKIQTIVDVLEGDVNTAPKDEHLFGVFVDVELDGDDVFNATGTALVNEEELGEVVLKNESNSDQPLVQVTRLSTQEGVTVRIDSNVVVPKNGQVRVGVYPHEDYETFFDEGKKIPAGTRLNIPGLSESRQLVVYAEVLNDLGYSGNEVAAVSEGDLTASSSALAEKLLQQALLQMKEEKGMTTNNALELFSHEVLSFESDAAVGEKTSSFNAKMKLHVFGVIINREHLLTFAKNRLTESLSEGKELSSIDEKTLNYSLDKLDLDAKTAHLAITLDGSSSLKVSSDLLEKQKIVGMNKRELVDYYSQFENIKRVEIRFFPFWIQKVPKQIDHIEVLIVES